MTMLGVALVLFLAALTQSLTGFGLALVSMPLLSLLIGLHEAVALVAVISLVVEVGILWRYFRHLTWRPVLHLVAASLIGIPLGILYLRRVPERGLLLGLGIVLAGYSLYALGGWRMPPLRHPAWAWLAGMLAGLLGGAYNTSGPPVILYAHARRWAPATFKANLQAFFLVSSSGVFLAHLLAGDITSLTWRRAALSLPAILAGLGLGGRLDRLLSPARFRQLVLMAIFLLGINMMWPR